MSYINQCMQPQVLNITMSRHECMTMNLGLYDIQVNALGLHVMYTCKHAHVYLHTHAHVHACIHGNFCEVDHLL